MSDEDRRYNAIIVVGSFTSVKEQMPGTYAQKFAKEGFVALASDYSHYGESEGKPRQLESPAEKLSALKAAVTYLTNLPYVQAVSMVNRRVVGSSPEVLPRTIWMAPMMLEQFQDRFDQLIEVPKVAGNGFVYQCLVNFEIFVYEHIAHSRHRSECFGKAFWD